jgi:hypothetical protein
MGLTGLMAGSSSAERTGGSMGAQDPRARCFLASEVWAQTATQLHNLLSIGRNAQSTRIGE